MNKKRIRILAGIGILLWLWPIVVCFAEEENGSRKEPSFSLYAQSAVLMDADTGRILYEKNGHEVRPMASTTKIMTCILALELGEADAVYTASAYAASMPNVKLGVTAGTEYRLVDLLYSLMLESHNDSAVMIAEGIAGSVPAFAARMNEKAQEIGATQTHFVTPNGLDGEDAGGIHATTAADLALILRYCFTESPKREDFLRITQTGSHSFTDTAGRCSHTVTNKNAFLTMMDGALTGKTGFTGKAGYCYVGALRRGERTYIVALLACGWPNNKNYKWTDTRHLMEFGLEQYEKRTVFEMGEMTWEMDVRNGQRAQVSVRVGGDVAALAAEGEVPCVTWCLPGELTAPIAAGEPIGWVWVGLDDILLEELPVIAVEEVGAWTLDLCLDEILGRFFLQNSVD